MERSQKLEKERVLAIQSVHNSFYKDCVKHIDEGAKRE